MNNPISKDLIQKLHEDHNEILQFLIKKNYQIYDLPSKHFAMKEEGEAFASAYPIQGVLKYHGIANVDHRIPYFPSVSLNNDCGSTVSFLRFDKHLKEDQAILNGEPALRDELERIKFELDFIRNYSKIKTKAILVSRNYLDLDKDLKIGKGLGTSASGASALALAAAAIIYNNDEEYVNNRRLISIFSRYLASSGARSTTGGFSLLFSHPNINPFDAFAVRLDLKKHRNFIESISLLTIPMESDLKTNQAHTIAPKSLFFPVWLEQRKGLIFEFLNALENFEIEKIGELAEYDTLCLHAVAMAIKRNNIIAWEPNTLKIMHKIREIREKFGYNVYFSIDTGPSLVLITTKNEKKEVIKELKNIIPKHKIIEGNIGGPSKIITPTSPEAKKLRGDIENFINL